MGKFLLLITLLGDNPEFSSEYREAFSNSRQALLTTDWVKTELDELKTTSEKWLYLYTGTTPEQLVYAGYAYPLVTGKLSTKPFKNFKHTTSSGFTFVPEIEYNFVRKESNVGLIVVKEF